ncbi:YmdB family metallophosphoesterase [bacterium]|nr:YmdB family metallophosphoesterase [bacterium]
MNKSDTFKILFFGDVVGRPGRFALRDFLAKKIQSGEISKENTFVIVNVENASHGFGLTEKNYNDISDYGADCMTSGNHIWDKKDIFEYIERAPKLVRPLNYPKTAPGKGSRIFEMPNGTKVGVINILGRVFMGNGTDSYWTMIEDEVKRIKEVTPVVLIDFHAEATAEKICFAKYCSTLGVSAFFGTHTHIQTADERIMNNMGYITDVGFCGSFESVIGMDYNTSYNRFTTVAQERYDVAGGDLIQINAAELEIDKTNGHTVDIKRISIIQDKKDKGNEN